MATDLIAGFAAHLRCESKSDGTIKRYAENLLRAHRDLPEGLDVACEEELIMWLWRPGLESSSRATYWAALAGFFKWAHVKGALDFNPFASVPCPKIPKRLPNPCTDDELRHILTEAREPFRTWALLAAYAGTRCMDIAGQDRRDITQERILIRRSKGGKQRTLPTHALIWEAVHELPAGRITTRTAKSVSSNAGYYFRKQLGLEGVTLHRLRHWFGTQVQRRYRNLLVTQQALGHEDPASTAGYALVVAEEVRAAIDLLPNLLLPSLDVGAAGPEAPALAAAP